MAEEQRGTNDGDNPEDETVISPKTGDDGDHTAIIRPPDDSTRIMPPADAAPAWAGRAGVPTPEPGPRLRDATSSGYRQSPPPSRGRTWWTPLLLGLLALGLVGVVVISAWLMMRGNGSSDNPTSSPTPAPSSAPPSPTQPASQPPSATATAAQLVQIPVHLVGLDLDDVTNQLNELGLNYSFDYQASAQPQNTIIGTKPGAGELVPLGSTVVLTISTGQSPSPSVTPSATPTS